MSILKKPILIVSAALTALLLGGIAFADDVLRSVPAVMTFQSVDWQGPERGDGYGPHGGQHQERGKFCDQEGWWSSLTDEQRESIEQSKLALHKDTTAVFAQLRVAEAELNLLSTADKVDQAAINAKIDDISLLQNQLMKRKAQHRQDVRKVLTEEQRLAYDAQGRGFHHGRSHHGMFGGGHERGHDRGPDHWQDSADRQSTAAAQGFQQI